MYAVVKSGGKQHKIEVGETFSVELIDAAPGAVITLPALLVNDGEKLFTGDDAKNATVTAEVLGHGKADKVLVFKFRKRKGSKKLKGHRQQLTLVKITDIALAGAKKAVKAEAATRKPAAKKPVAVKAEAAVKKAPVTKKVDAAEKPAAKKPAAKKPAAKKPAAKKAVATKKPAAAKPAAKKPAAKKTTKPAESAE
jgi:large subunit ribosomal protein L21